MRTVYVFGNPLVEEDSLPLRILPNLRELLPYIRFEEFDTTEDLDPKDGLVILDTANGIEKVQLIEDIDMLDAGKIYTMHDFDLGLTLKLWKKAGMIEDAKMICVPEGMKEDDAILQIERIIRSILPSENE
jgi:hypothetical protein